MSLQIDTDYSKKFEPAVVIESLGDEFDMRPESKEVGFCNHPDCHRPSEFHPGSRNRNFDNIKIWKCKHCGDVQTYCLPLDELDRFERLSEIEKDGWSTAATRW